MIWPSVNARQLVVSLPILNAVEAIRTRVGRSGQGIQVCHATTTAALAAGAHFGFGSREQSLGQVSFH